jgi:hypothetical protein
MFFPTWRYDIPLVSPLCLLFLARFPGWHSQILYRKAIHRISCAERSVLSRAGLAAKVLNNLKAHQPASYPAGLQVRLDSSGPMWNFSRQQSCHRPKLRKSLESKVTVYRFATARGLACCPRGLVLAQLSLVCI